MAKWDMEKMYNYCKEHNLDLPKENQEYKGVHNKYVYICPKHGEYNQEWNIHRKGKRCRKCHSEKLSKKFTKTNEQYIFECKEKGIDLPIEKYKGGHKKIKHKCNRCGNIYPMTPANHLFSQGCPKCKYKNTTRKDLIYYRNNYSNICKKRNLDLPIESYVNSNKKIKHKCNRCGNVYTVSPNQHLCSRESSCPVCNESHGEKFIRNYLDKHNIKYESQKKFKDLKDKTYLSYDFYLPDYNILIEYQGIQHYQAEDYFGGKKQFEKQQLHDKLKREYAKANEYKLLELKYTLDTQELVNKYLSRRIKG